MLGNSTKVVQICLDKHQWPVQYNPSVHDELYSTIHQYMISRTVQPVSACLDNLDNFFLINLALLPTSYHPKQQPPHVSMAMSPYITNCTIKVLILSLFRFIEIIICQIVSMSQPQTLPFANSDKIQFLLLRTGAKTLNILGSVPPQGQFVALFL